MVLGVDKLSLIHQFFPVFLLPHPSFHPGGNSKCLALVTICLERSSKKTCRNPKLIYAQKRTPAPSIGRENFPSTTSSPWWWCVCVRDGKRCRVAHSNKPEPNGERRTYQRLRNELCCCVAGFLCTRSPLQCQSVPRPASERSSGLSGLSLFVV